MEPNRSQDLQSEAKDPGELRVKFPSESKDL